MNAILLIKIYTKIIHFLIIFYKFAKKRKRRRIKITTAEIEMRNALLSFYVSAIFGIKVKVLNNTTEKEKFNNMTIPF